MTTICITLVGLFLVLCLTSFIVVLVGCMDRIIRGVK